MAKRKLFSRSQLRKSAPLAHMTWASQSLSGTVARTRAFLSRRLWVWPIIAVTLLLVIGWAVHGSIERTMKANLRSQLQTLLDVEVAMLRTWLEAQQKNVLSVASDAEVRELTLALLGPEVEVTDDPQGDLAQRLHRSLRPEMNSHDYENFLVADREEVVASSRAEGVGLSLPAEFAEAINRDIDT